MFHTSDTYPICFAKQHTHTQVHEAIVAGLFFSTVETNCQVSTQIFLILTDRPCPEKTVPDLAVVRPLRS